MSPTNELRTWREIQRTHDIIHSVLYDRLPIDLSPEAREQLEIMYSVLCWVLKHENPNFPDSFARLEQAIQSLGLVFMELQ